MSRQLSVVSRKREKRDLLVDGRFHAGKKVSFIVVEPLLPPQAPLATFIRITS